MATLVAHRALKLQALDPRRLPRVSPRHLQAYLDEYCYRLNRRDKREDIFRRLLYRCLLYTGPAPYSLLTGT